MGEGLKISADADDRKSRTPEADVATRPRLGFEDQVDMVRELPPEMRDDFDNFVKFQKAKKKTMQRKELSAAEKKRHDANTKKTAEPSATGTGGTKGAPKVPRSSAIPASSSSPSLLADVSPSTSSTAERAVSGAERNAIASVRASLPAQFIVELAQSGSVTLRWHAFLSGGDRKASQIFPGGISG